MSETNCTHNCNTCGENCSSRQTEQTSFLEPLNPASTVKKVIGVVSGKGGVGKSLVTTMMAVRMNAKIIRRQFLMRILPDLRFRRHLAWEMTVSA